MSTHAAEEATALPVAERSAALLHISEDQWFERKSARIAARDLADAIVALANAEGGTIVVGLSNGRVEGIDGDAAVRLADWQQAALDFTVPTVRCGCRIVDVVGSDGAPRRLAVFDVAASNQVHANRRDEVFLRVGDESRRLTFTQRQELLYDKGQSTFESTLVPGARVGDLDAELLGSYADAVGHPEPLRLLSARGLLDRSGDVTVAAVLLFAREPQRWFPEASVRVLRYRGTERGTGSRQQLLHDRRIDGPIPVQLEHARTEIVEQLPTRRALGRSGRFQKVPLVPEDAWLEAVVNAVVHRSYSMGGDHIRVEIFDDRIEIDSPGRFPGIADAADPRHVTRFARNPRIARVCADLAIGQELGEGIRRMFDEMHLAGLGDPEYVQTSGSVRVTLSSTPVDRELEAQLPAGSLDLVRIIRDAGSLSTGEIVEAAGRSRPVVIRLLNGLRDAGVVSWTGASPKDPQARWSLPT